MNNIRFGRPEATDEEVMAAARLATPMTLLSAYPGATDHPG